MHAVVARSTFGSENVQNTRARDSDRFLTIRLPFHVEKVHAVVARSAFGSQTCQKLRFEADFDVSDVVLLTDRWI